MSARSSRWVVTGPQGQRTRVVLELDESKVITALLHRAKRSKHGRCTALDSAIILKIEKSVDEKKDPQ